MSINKHHDKKLTLIKGTDKHFAVLSVKYDRLKCTQKKFKSSTPKIKLIKATKKRSEIYLLPKS